MVLKTPSHARGKAGEVEFVSEQAGDGRKNANHSNIWVDEDVIELSSSKKKTKSCKKGRPGSSKQLHLLRIVVDSVLDKEDSLKGKIHDNSLPLKFTFGVEDTIVLEKAKI